MFPSTYPGAYRHLVDGTKRLLPVNFTERRNNTVPRVHFLFPVDLPGGHPGNSSTEQNTSVPVNFTGTKEQHCPPSSFFVPVDLPGGHTGMSSTEQKTCVPVNFTGTKEQHRPPSSFFVPRRPTRGAYRHVVDGTKNVCTP